MHVQLYYFKASFDRRADACSGPARKILISTFSPTFVKFLKPILRLLNLQLQRQHCSSLERFSKNIFFKLSKRARLPNVL
jgi:hypothetical protein